MGVAVFDGIESATRAVKVGSIKLSGYDDQDLFALSVRAATQYDASSEKINQRVIDVHGRGLNQIGLLAGPALAAVNPLLGLGLLARGIYNAVTRDGKVNRTLDDLAGTNPEYRVVIEFNRALDEMCGRTAWTSSKRPDGKMVFSYSAPSSDITAS
jgi:hypothetical protein